MKIILRAYDKECVCQKCGWSSRNPFSHYAPCPRCGREWVWGWRVVRWVLVGPWYAPWRWRYVPEAP